YNCVPDQDGFYTANAPRSTGGRIKVAPQWRILSGADFRENLTGKQVKQSDPILRVGEKNGEWEIEVKIPQKHSGQIKAAYQTTNLDEEMDVDLKLENMPTVTYRGKLARRAIAGEAVPNRDEHNESEPIVISTVRVTGDDIPEEMRIPREVLE